MNNGVCVCVDSTVMCVGQREFVREKKNTCMNVKYNITVCERESGLLCMREKERVPSRLYYFVMLNG